MTDRTTREATISFRALPETEAQLEAIAHAQGLTLSTLLNNEALALIERERRRYLRLKAAFDVAQDLPGEIR